MRRLVLSGALIIAAVSRVDAQVIERPVPFDSAGYLMVMTPSIAAQAGLRTPWWPVSGDFREARLFTSNDSIYVLAVTRPSGVVERYSMAAIDRDAILATVSKLPREALEARSDARNRFIRNQTLLGILVYGPTFSGAIGSNDAAYGTAYLVMAGGSFFVASEISRRMSISRAQADLSTNTGFNGGLAGWGATYLVGGKGRAQSAGAFIGGITGTALGLRASKHMTEAEAVGSGFGSDLGAIIAFGTMETLRGEERCTYDPVTFTSTCTRRKLSNKAEVATVLGALLVGYPIGVLYPRNAGYNVTAGDIHTLGTTGVLGAVAGLALLSEHSSYSSFAGVATGGAVLGVFLGDKLLVQRFDHDRGDADRLSLGTAAGGLMGAGIAALSRSTRNNPHAIFGLSFAGGLAGLIATERYLDPASDAGRRRVRVSFNPTSIALLAAHAPGSHSLLNVNF